MIGYYVHHQGRGHLHRALSVAAASDEPVTILTSAPRPATLPGGVAWVSLAPDDADRAPPLRPTAGGRLHWAPLGEPGLRRRMRQVADWLDDTSPRLVVVDVSVEVALLVRLHGVPVVGVVLPGRRTDAPHLLGFDVCDELVAVWPAEATSGMLPDLPQHVRDRVHAVGGLSRSPVTASPVRPAPRGAEQERTVVLMLGAGGHDIAPAAVQAATAATPRWRWTVLDGTPGRWSADPAPLLRAADVVITHCGQNAVAEVAAARRPAVVVPQARPHDEQAVTAGVLSQDRWPALVESTFPVDGWPGRLAAAAALDGRAWAGWCDGAAAERFVAVLTRSGARIEVGR